MMKQRIFGPLPARYAEYGDLIHESGTHLLDLIGDVLDMSKIEADRYELETEEFDARDVVEICSKMLRLRAEEKQVALSTDVGDRPLMVEADRKALRQILLNLLSNAVKFTPEGGAVVAMVQPQDGALVLAVGDSGVGISADELSGVGHAWNQAQSARDSDERGSGLGLSLVRALAELHGGSMSVQSAPGEGTTVSVILPVLVDAGLEPAGTDAALEVHQRIKAAQSLGEELQSNATA
jgi:cell cycle sensor histidine kinase DivJ